jgi:trigger factor
MFTRSDKVFISWEILEVQVTITPLSDVAQEAVIQLSNEELLPHFEKAYEKYRTKVELKGFRKGKVPMAMIKRLYGESIEQEALDGVAGDTFREAMKEKSILPIGQPTMTDMDFKRGEHFRFTIKYEIRPAIALKQYTGIAVERPVHQITDEEVENEIMSIRRANGTLSPADAATDTDHVVTADAQELDESGTPIVGKKTAGARFFLWDESLAREIREVLLNAKPGDTTTVKFESQHGDHAHSIHLALSITGIEKMTLPPLDNALAAKVTGGKVSTAEEFLTNLRNDIQKYWDDQSGRALENNIVASLVKAHDFPVPEAVVDGFLESFVEDAKNRSKDRQLPKGFDVAKFNEENRPLAEWQAKWMLLKERITEEEHIELTDADMEDRATSESASMGIPKERILELYRKSPGARDRLLTDKLMAFLRERATITDTPLAAG